MAPYEAHRNILIETSTILKIPCWRHTTNVEHCETIGTFMIEISILKYKICFIDKTERRSYSLTMIIIINLAHKWFS